MKKTIKTFLLTFVLGINTGCTCLNLNNCLESSVLSTATSQANQVLTDKELNDLYKKYFPNNRFELSNQGLPNNIKTYIRPNINPNSGPLYNFEAGFEKRY